MIKTKEMYAGCYYLLKGEASANSCFIENIYEAKLFIKLANRYLKGYVKIHEYLLTAEGWMIQVTIRKRSKIKAEYDKKRKKTNNHGLSEKAIWYIVSEQVRLLLSQYVTRTNRLEGRSGSKVKESYKRYYFESASEARKTIKKIRDQKFKMIQRNKKYRKVKTHYNIPKNIGKGSLFLCSKWLKDKVEGVIQGKKSGFNKLYSIGLDSLIVANKTNATYYIHSNKNSS